MFTQEHTEVGRDGRGLLLRQRQSDARVGSVGTQNEFDRRLPRVHDKGELVLVDLGDPIDPSADEEGIEFLG